MPKFSYRAVNAKGRPIRGVVAAANESDLTTRLEEGGLALVDCKEMSEKVGGLSSIFARKVKIRDLVQMFVHLEQLQKAGVPLMDGLSDVRDTTDSPRLRDILSDVYREVAEGNSFSHALSRHPRVFEKIFVSLIASGEETGNLTNSFSQVIRHLKWTDAMRSKIKKATRYPKILMVVVTGVIMVMMCYVVPDVVGFLKDIGKKLPPVTTALIATSDFFASYSIYIVVGMVIFYALMRIARAVSEGFLYYTDYLALNTPVMGPLIRKISLSQFCSTFGVLFSSGLEILKCLDAAKLTAGNAVMVEALSSVRERVQEGLPLSAALTRSGEFPTLVVRMVKVGEESGNLTGVLEQVTEFYDKDVNEAIDAMIQMIEPTLTVILGGDDSLDRSRSLRPDLRQFRRYEQIEMGLVVSRKRILVVGGEGVTLFGPTARGIEREAALSWEVPNFDQQLVEALNEQNKTDPVLILFDGADQTWRKEENIPKLSPFDRARYIKRKLDQTFPSYPVRASIQVKPPGESPFYLFVALPETDRLDSIAADMQEAGVQLAGFGLLPAESVGLVKALASKVFTKEDRPSRWAVLISQHETGGLRQVIVKNGNIALTRLTPTSEAGVHGPGWADEVVREFKGTLTYIARLGYLAEEGLDVMVVCSSIEKQFFSDKSLPVTNFQCITPAEALAAIGSQGISLGETNFGDVVHAAWVAKQRSLTVPVVVPSIQRIMVPRKMARLASAALFLALMGLGFFVSSEYSDYISVKNDAKSAPEGTSGPGICPGLESF